MIDESGAAVANYTYNAWGEILSSSGTMAEINPLRYRGYYYDTETGFYYLQSRYYDPVTHRFINADSLASTSQGIMGTNMFAYCNNNPVNMEDQLGYMPGDLFNTIDEAAEDFANYTNTISIDTNHEYASYVYEVIAIDPVTFFVGNYEITIFRITKKYSYVIPLKGGSDNTILISFLEYPATKVALLHTHAAYASGYDNDNFSTADKILAAISGVPYYVATPLGTLRKFDPIGWTDTLISDDIPYDPEHPGRQGE